MNNRALRQATLQAISQSDLPIQQKAMLRLWLRLRPRTVLGEIKDQAEAEGVRIPEHGEVSQPDWLEIVKLIVQLLPVIFALIQLLSSEATEDFDGD